jgi:hypothetical protein
MYTRMLSHAREVRRRPCHTTRARRDGNKQVACNVLSSETPERRLATLLCSNTLLDIHCSTVAVARL